MWPVINRELRAESRRPFTYWLRVIGAVSLLAAIIFTIEQPRSWNRISGLPTVQAHQVMGRILFGNVNGVLFGLIWLIVPLLTADCITREKREGTLGLLFLTPLTAEGIVVGKLFAHALRALTFVLTMLPVLSVPLLVGGIDQKDLFMALLLDLSAMVLALAAGLLASSWTQRWFTALLLAQALGFVFAILLMRTHWALFQAVLGSANLPGGVPGAFSVGTIYGSFEQGRGGIFQSLFQLLRFNTSADADLQPVWMGRGFPPQFSVGSIWNNVWTSGNPLVVRQWFGVVGSIFVGSCAVFVIVIFLAASGVRRSWRMRAQSPRAIQLERRFFKPRYWPGLFRRQRRRSLQRNPIGWLQQYSVGARLTKWGWCLFVVIVECLFTMDLDDAVLGQIFVFIMLLLGMTFTAAGSFRRDRETGALELLLVTPLKVGQIVAGRLGGIWRQFLPATSLALAAAIYVSTFDGSIFNGPGLMKTTLGISFLLSSYLAIPVIGLYWSMRRSNYLVAWIGVTLCALVFPFVLVGAFHFGFETESDDLILDLVFMGTQMGITVLCARALMTNLAARRFVLPA